MGWSFLMCCVGAAAAFPLALEGRTYRVLPDDAAVAAYIRSRVAELAATCIARKGGFSLSIGSGTTVAPLVGLKEERPDIDFEKFHLFFGNERTTGDTAFKCFQGASAFIDACSIPAANVHKVPGGEDPEESAIAYEAELKSLQMRGWLNRVVGEKPVETEAELEEAVGSCVRTGLPALDCVLLGSGADGHCASLYPGSSQVLASPGERVVLPAEGKGGVTLSLDTIGSASNVIISAGKAAQAEMVATALGPTAHGLPAGMIGAAVGTQVEWLLTEASAAKLTL
jgi:6-phosphogluconolactonase